MRISEHPEISAHMAAYGLAICHIHFHRRKPDCSRLRMEMKKDTLLTMPALVDSAKVAELFSGEKIGYLFQLCPQTRQSGRRTAGIRWKVM